MIQVTRDNAAGPQADMQAQVARELSGIFAKAPGMTALRSETRSNLPRKRVGPGTPAGARTEQAARRSGFRVLWLAIIAFILLGVAVAGWFHVKTLSGNVPVAARIATPITVRKEARESGSQRSSPVLGGPSLSRAPNSATASESLTAHGAASGRDVAQGRGKPARLARQTDKSKLLSQANDAPLNTAAARNGDCARLALPERSWCLRPALLAADQRLRTAYERARSAGASGRLLGRYQKRWISVRRNADDAPDYVIDQYIGLAQRLESLSAQPASGAEH